MDLWNRFCFTLRCECGSCDLFPVPPRLQSAALAYLYCLLGCDMDCLLYYTFWPTHSSPCFQRVCYSVLDYLVRHPTSVQTLYCRLTSARFVSVMVCAIMPVRIAASCRGFFAFSCPNRRHTTSEVSSTILDLHTTSIEANRTWQSTTGAGYASHNFVWLEWQNDTGYSSNGFVFLAGMLNGAFAIGTPDGCSHRKFLLRAVDCLRITSDKPHPPQSPKKFPIPTKTSPKASPPNSSPAS